MRCRSASSTRGSASSRRRGRRTRNDGDNSAEFNLKINGQPLSNFGITVNGRPRVFVIAQTGADAVEITGTDQQIADQIRNRHGVVFRYNISGAVPEAGELAVEFIAGGFQDNGNNANFAEVQYVSLVNRPSPNAPLPPSS